MQPESPEYGSSSSSTTVFLSIPEGPRYRGKVKLISGIEDFADQVHPGKPHRWREMLHFGERGTGFVECLCGANGIPYRLPRRKRDVK